MKAAEAFEVVEDAMSLLKGILDDAECNSETQFDYYTPAWEVADAIQNAINSSTTWEEAVRTIRRVRKQVEA